MQFELELHTSSGTSLALRCDGSNDGIEDLRRRAFTDALTGLPNAIALEDELATHAVTTPFSVLVLDFDGLRSANQAFGYRDGGDVLIHCVAQALAALIRPGEFAARLHTAGDEFVVLLPGLAKAEAQRRGQQIERALDELGVPQTHRELYGGASVGVASRRFSETPGQVLGRAVDAMQTRKRERHGDPITSPVA